MIQRLNPKIDYLEDDVFAAFSFTQVVKAGDQVLVSGIAPLRGGLANLEVVGVGELTTQIEFCFEVLRRSLEAVGLGLGDVISHTLYTTDMPGFLNTAAPLLAKTYGSEGPTSTAVEVRALFHPDQLFEVSAVAYNPAR